MKPEEWGECVQEVGGVKVATIKCFEPLFKNILVAAGSLITLVLFIILLVGGFKYLTSGGNPKATEEAKNTMTYALVGLIVIVGSYLILKVIEYFTGTTLTRFEIPTHSFPSPSP